MLCARVINGIGTGFLNAVVPVWTAEVATHTSRGMLSFLLLSSTLSYGSPWPRSGATIAMEFTLNIFGVVVAYWLEFGMGFIGDGNTEVSKLSPRFSAFSRQRTISNLRDCPQVRWRVRYFLQDIGYSWDDI